MIGYKIKFSYEYDYGYADAPTTYIHDSGIVLDKLTSFWSGTTYLVKNDDGNLFRISPSQIYEVQEPKKEIPSTLQ